MGYIFYRKNHMRNIFRLLLLLYRLLGFSFSFHRKLPESEEANHVFLGRGGRGFFVGGYRARADLLPPSPLLPHSPSVVLLLLCRRSFREYRFGCAWVYLETSCMGGCLLGTCGNMNLARKLSVSPWSKSKRYCVFKANGTRIL